MKTLAAPILAMILAASATAGELSITVTDSAEVYSQIKLDLEEWIRHPTGTTDCNSAQCCLLTATDEQCTDLAKSASSSPDFWVRKLFVCIQADADWACHVENVQSGQQLIMYCETVPGTAAVRQEDVARCASEQAAVTF